MRMIACAALMVLAACPTEGNPAQLWLANGKTETTVKLVEVKPHPF